MQICSREVFDVINIRTKKKQDQLSMVSNTGVIYHPRLKEKAKLFFVTNNNFKNILSEAAYS